MNLLFLILLSFVQAEESPMGKVTALEQDGKYILVDLGEESRIKVGEYLDIFSRPEIINDPLTGKTSYSREVKIGRAQVADIGKSHSRATVISRDDNVEIGCRVRLSEEKASGPHPPKIDGNYSMDPVQAHWGTIATIKLDVSDEDDDLDWITCSIDGGVLLDSFSTNQKIHWLPPAKKGNYNLAVAAYDKSGLVGKRNIVVPGSGLAGNRFPVRFELDRSFSDPFRNAVDLGSDHHGNLYVLDSKLRRIIKWTPLGERVWISDSYGRDLEFIRMWIQGEDALLLDRLGRRVLRYALRSDMFSAGVRVQYAGNRRRPGSLRDPVDLIVTKEGSLWVLDRLAGTIKTYAPDGPYQSTVGEFDLPTRMSKDANGSVHILDAGRRVIVEFKGLIIQNTTRLPATEDGVPVDFEPGMLLYGDHIRELSVEKASVVRRDRFGRLYVIEQAGKSILRVNEQGEFTGRKGGMDLTATTGIRALANAGYALEGPGDAWFFDAGGWMVEKNVVPSSPIPSQAADGATYEMKDGRVTCNGRPLELGSKKLAGVCPDPFGRVLLLETGTGNVYRLKSHR